MAAERDNEPLQEFWPRAKLSLMPSIVNGDIVNPGDTITHPPQLFGMATVNKSDEKDFSPF